MTDEKFAEAIERMDRLTKSVLCAKAKEYATDDRLHNFKFAGSLQRITPEAALGGMMAKHTVCVYDMINGVDSGESYPIEVWEEKIGDSINYLYLLYALVVERMEHGEHE